MYNRYTSAANKKYTGRDRKLWELENKIDAGLLIEFPRIVAVNEHKYVLETFDDEDCIKQIVYTTEDDAVKALVELEQHAWSEAWDIVEGRCNKNGNGTL